MYNKRMKLKNLGKYGLFFDKVEIFYGFEPIATCYNSCDYELAVKHYGDSKVGCIVSNENGINIVLKTLVYYKKKTPNKKNG